MTTSIYKVNKGINRSIEFKGLKAQYIWYMGGGLVVLMILFSILYFVGLPSYVCIAVIAGCGTMLVMKIYKLSRKYGEHGLMKALARRQVPKVVRCRSRRIFISFDKKIIE